MLYRHQLRPMVSPQTKVTLYRHNLRPCTATNQGQIVSPHTKSKLYRKNLSQNCLIFYHCWGTRDNEWQGLSRSKFVTILNWLLNVSGPILWAPKPAYFETSWSFVCGFSSHSGIFYSYGDAAITWPKYCRYGVKRYPINQSYGDVKITVEGSQNLTYAPYARHLWPLSSQFVLLVWSLSSHLRIFHSSRKVTITGEGLQILTYARHSWPGSLTCRTYCDTGQTL